MEEVKKGENWVAEFGFVKDGHWRRHIVAVPSHEADFIKEYKTDCFRSIYLFKSWVEKPEFKKVGPLIGDFPMDFDSKDLEVAREEAKRYIQFLQQMKVPAGAIQAFFSGSKGFHVIVAKEIFGIEPCEDLPQVYREMYQMFRAECGLLSADSKIYHRSAMLRLPDSINSKSGKYKAILDFGTLKEIPADVLASSGVPEICRDVEPIGRDVVTEARKRVARKEAAWKSIDTETRIAGIASDEPKPCIAEGLEGVEVSQRNDTLYWIAMDCKLRGMTIGIAKEVVARWNKRNEEPLETKELEATLKGVYEHQYRWQCNVIRTLGLRCDTSECPLHKKVTPKDNTEPSADLKLILEDPGLLHRIHRTLADIVGEDENKLMMFLLELGGESVELSGESSSGKNTVVDRVLSLFPPDWYTKVTALSEKSLRYLGKKIHTLYLAERPHRKKDEESQADADIKLNISEGKIVALVAKPGSKHGDFKTDEVVTEIKNVIMTTTDIAMAPELENRIWTIVTDDSWALTEKVLQHQASIEALLPSERPDYEGPKRLIRQIVQVVDEGSPPFVVIPYSMSLIQWVQKEPRARRDLTKMFCLVHTIAKLHYKQNLVFVDKDTPVLIAGPEDYIMAERIASGVMVQTFSGITNRLRGYYTLACKVLDRGHKLTAQTLVDESTQAGRKVESRTAQRVLQDLENHGLLKLVEEQRPKVYDRNVNLNQMDRERPYTPPSAAILREIVSAYEMWCQKHSVTPVRRKIIDPFTGQELTEEMLRERGSEEAKRGLQATLLDPVRKQTLDVTLMRESYRKWLAEVMRIDPWAVGGWDFTGLKRNMPDGEVFVDNVARFSWATICLENSVISSSKRCILHPELESMLMDRLVDYLSHTTVHELCHILGDLNDHDVHVAMETMSLAPEERFQPVWFGHEEEVLEE